MLINHRITTSIKLASINLYTWLESAEVPCKSKCKCNTQCNDPSPGQESRAIIIRLSHLPTFPQSFLSTVPLKRKLPPSRQTRVVSNECTGSTNSYTARNLRRRTTKILSANERVLHHLNQRFMPNRTGDVLAATICKTKFICLIDSSTRVA